MSAPKPVPTAEQLEAIKAKVIADPNTKRIADSLQMPFDEYVALVMKYSANPNLQPEIYIADDADLKAELGYEAPSMEKMAAYINEHAEAIEVSTKSKFADPNSQRERVTGKIPVAPPATANPEEVRKDLKADLDRVRTSGKFKKF